MTNVSSFVVSNIVYDLFDMGISNTLGLETLRHGTNFINYWGIRISGGDPYHGGKDSGSTKTWREDDTKHRFYVFKDSEWNLRVSPILTPTKVCILFVLRIKGIGSRMFARSHSALSGYNFVAQFSSNKTTQSMAAKYFLIFASYVNGMCSIFISPTLRFRFSKIDSTRFEEDLCYNGVAYQTKQIIEPWRIGLLGSLLTGVNLDWFARVRAHPCKILTGIVQISSAVAITILCINPLIANPSLIIPAIAGVLMA